MDERLFLWAKEQIPKARLLKPDLNIWDQKWKKIVMVLALSWLNFGKKSCSRNEVLGIFCLFFVFVRADFTISSFHGSISLVRHRLSHFLVACMESRYLSVEGFGGSRVYTSRKSDATRDPTPSRIREIHMRTTRSRKRQREVQESWWSGLHSYYSKSPGWTVRNTYVW